MEPASLPSSAAASWQPSVRDCRRQASSMSFLRTASVTWGQGPGDQGSGEEAGRASRSKREAGYELRCTTGQALQPASSGNLCLAPQAGRPYPWDCNKGFPPSSPAFFQNALHCSALSRQLPWAHACLHHAASPKPAGAGPHLFHLWQGRLALPVWPALLEVAQVQYRVAAPQQAGGRSRWGDREVGRHPWGAEKMCLARLAGRCKPASGLARRDAHCWNKAERGVVGRVGRQAAQEGPQPGWRLTP